MYATLISLAVYSQHSFRIARAHDSEVAYRHIYVHIDKYY